MTKLPNRQEESLGGFIVHGIPFPVETDPEALAFLKRMAPLRIENEYRITYKTGFSRLPA